MPTQTDRDKIKDQQEGVYLGAAGISNAKSAVSAMHARPVFDHRKAGAENAATNVSELPLTTCFHASKGKKFGIQTTANIAANATDYLIIRFYKRVAGTSTVIASWNTHTSAQGALTTAAPAVISTATTGLVINTDADIPADAGITYDIGKVGAGKDLPAGSILSGWLEEV